MTIETIITLIGAVGGTTALIELAKFLLTRRAQRKKAEAEADLAATSANTEEWRMWREQLDRMNAQIEFKDKRIEDLNTDLDGKEKRFAAQTQRLRECQDRELEARKEVQRLTTEVCALEIQLKDHRCVRLTCLERKPKNEHTKRAIAAADTAKKQTTKKTKTQ